jgi:hypothetical protein
MMAFAGAFVFAFVCGPARTALSRTSLTARIQRCELMPPKINEVLPQAALPPDPRLHSCWIGLSDEPCRIPGAEGSTTLAVIHQWSMEAENGSLRYTDPAARNSAQHKRTGGETGSINDNPFPRFPHLQKEIQI